MPMPRGEFRANKELRSLCEGRIDHVEARIERLEARMDRMFCWMLALMGGILASMVATVVARLA